MERKENNNLQRQAREPPKLMRFTIWCCGGDFRDDALDEFDDLFKAAAVKFGYGSALLWGASQCLRSLPRAIWAFIAQLVGAFFR